MRRAKRDVVERIRAAILSGEEISLVYVKYNVQQYGCHKRTFQRAVAAWKRDFSIRQESAEAERASTTDELLQSLLDAVQVDLDAGRPLDGKMGDLIRACVQARKLDFEREAEKRAADKHEAWKAEHAKKQAAALDENAGPAGLTPEQLAVIKSKVLGI